MIIRDYEPRDFQTICAIDRLCFEPGVSYSSEEMREWLALSGVFALIGEEEPAGVHSRASGPGDVPRGTAAPGTRIAGFVLARKTRAHHAHIITIDVLPECRRSGIGGKLMQAAQERLREQGVRRVRLEVSVENADALQFYERLGYVTAGRIPRYYLDRIDAWTMIKELSD